MSEGMIPVGPGDLPIETTPLDDDRVYTGEFTKAALAMKLDAGGFVYCAIQVVVTEGDFEGRTVNRNWLRLPVAITGDMAKRDQIKAADSNVAFGRFARAFGLKGSMPIVNFNNQETKDAWHAWIEQFYGNVGKFTVQNQEYQGQMRSGIQDFVF